MDQVEQEQLLNLRKITAQLIALITQLGAVSLLCDLLLFRGSELPWVARYLLDVVLALAICRSHGWVWLLAVQTHLVIYEQSEPLSGRSLVTAGFAIILLAYSLSAPRHHAALSDRIESWLPSRAGMPRRSWDGLEAWLSPLLLIAISIFAAVLILDWLPVSRERRDNWFARSLANEETLWPGATMTTILVGSLILCREAAWRRMTKPQAGSYLRSQFVREHSRELSKFVRRRLRSVRRAMLRKD